MNAKKQHSAAKTAEQATPATTTLSYPKGEIATGILWLSLGALISVLLEVVYLATWLPIPGTDRAIPFPYTIVVAFLFNRVLTRTSLLWTKRLAIAAIPLWIWVAGFVGLTFTGALSGSILVASDIRSMMLLLAGLAGGAWPLITSVITLTQPLETKNQL